MSTITTGNEMLKDDKLYMRSEKVLENSQGQDMPSWHMVME